MEISINDLGYTLTRLYEAEKAAQRARYNLTVLAESHYPDLLLDLSDVLDEGTKKILKEHGVFTVPQLSRLTQTEILSWPNIGRRRLNEIKVVLESHGLFLIYD